MKCLYPITISQRINGAEHEQQVRCNQCLPCRITRRGEWATRITLESLLHPPNHSLFVTKTLKPENWPEYGSVELEEIQQYMKRLRKQVDEKLRYYEVAEYGSPEKNEHPHYHQALFGMPLNVQIEHKKLEIINKELKQFTKDWKDKGHYWRNELSNAEKVLMHAWQYKGSIKAFPLNMAMAQYVAGYIANKVTKDFDPGPNRKQEFAVMSRKPGIGLDFAPVIVDALIKAKVYPAEHPNMARGKSWKPILFNSVLRFPSVAKQGQSIFAPIDKNLRSRIIKLMGGDNRTELKKLMQSKYGEAIIKNEIKKTYGKAAVLEIETKQFQQQAKLCRDYQQKSYRRKL